MLIVVEDQYNVNDWVRIGSYEGTVELFTLRLTRLRSLEGNLIMIPNSTIQEVINYTKDWSYAAIYVTIPYEADYPKAKEIMLALADETVAGGDPQIYGPYSFSGITDYVSDGVKFRCLIKTAPGLPVEGRLQIQGRAPRALQRRRNQVRISRRQQLHRR